MAFPFLLVFISLLIFRPFPTAANPTYIVHLQPELSSQWHLHFPIIHHYRHIFTGFAAKLSEQDLNAIKQTKGFISARRERLLSLHTTRSPRFLGLLPRQGFWNASSYGEGVIIGMVDTGVSPHHASFGDRGIPAPPEKWKGKCDLDSCNRKLIGARYFNFSTNPADDFGHGTHTASTAAGNFVRKASIFGNARGRAAGVAPQAHLAFYKACGLSGCYESDVLRAMEAAIDDGVDVLSISLGGYPNPFYSDYLSIAAYRAMEKGVFVAFSAGNAGPESESVSNAAPWILTVGASTIDRKLNVIALLGDDENNHIPLMGQSAFQTRDLPKHDVIFPGGITDNDTYRVCDGEFGVDIKGKIVVCEYGGGYNRVEKGEAVKKHGGAGLILMNTETQGSTTLAEAHVLPACHIGYEDSLKLLAYLNSTSSPVARILFRGTTFGDHSAPAVAFFSSRGPSMVTPGILKPDIIGPGVNILAAWPLSIDHETNAKSSFNMISGTSMSCPHLAGVAALIKSTHPDWSPAAIKSAILTTAYQTDGSDYPIEDEKLKPADIFAIGAGHVNPSAANDPGLVYDLQPDDYIPYLCGLNYTNQQIEIITQKKVYCSVETSFPEAQLNYPSFSIVLDSTPQRFSRTVTNVGEDNTTYTVEIIAPAGVLVEVKPEKLSFTKLEQKLSYDVSFTPSKTKTARKLSQGFIRWKNSKYSVRSPIAVVFQ